MSTAAPNNLLPHPYCNWEILPPWVDPSVDDVRYQRFVRTPTGEMIPLLSEKGYSLFNSYKRFLLASGSKKSGKSITKANRFLRHAWEVDGSVLAVIGSTIANTKGGTWRDLLKFVLPGWIAANFGMKIIRQGSDASSKKEYIIISNKHGGESEIQIHSLSVEDEVEKKFRSLRFSCIWLAEADLFIQRSVFDLLRQQLRLIGIPQSQHQFMFDCNPPLDGDAHWLHDIFRKAADPKSKHYVKNHEESFQEFQFGLDDNPFLPEVDKQEIKNSYAHDPVKYSRFVDGLWIVDTAESLFNETFIFNVHVKGDCASADKSEWEIIVPPADAPRLLTGTDTGAFNNATSFLVPRLNDQDLWVYDCFDEVCNFGKQMSMEEYAGLVWERIQFWNSWMVAEYKLKEPPIWRNWADSSLFSFESKSNNNDAEIFWEVSGGQINMRSPKGQKHRRQVAARVAMMQRLFFGQRFFISAQCEHNIAWARHLRAGTTRQETLRTGQIYTHTFSATSYAIGAELPFELFQQQTPSTATGIMTIDT